MKGCVKMENLVTSASSDKTLTTEYLRNANALLALLHGKSDSVCRFFDKEIIVDINQLDSLNSLILEKLSLHNVSTITTSIDVSLIDKRTLSYKAWEDFKKENINAINSATKSIFIQWDFFAEFKNYKVPQRHTLNVRITSGLQPSDMFKVLLNGALDERDDFDLQCCTTVCKVDFINNALAEELLNVVQRWTELCESACSEKGHIRPFLFKYRSGLANFVEVCAIFSFCTVIAIIVKLLIYYHLIDFQVENTACLLIFLIPLATISEKVGRFFGKIIYSELSDLMDTHIFRISLGDSKQAQKITEKSHYRKSAGVFAFNIATSIILPFVFFLLGR